MIKTLTAWTNEVDDEELAVQQIISQLDLEQNLSKNTIGIVACHYEFVLSGIFKAVCDALPFDVVGTISSSQAVADEVDTLIFTLMVLTGDDVEFVKTLTPSLGEEPAVKITESYKSAVRGDKPALVFTFAPFMLQNSGDEYVNVLSEVSGGVPCFGTLAIDDTPDFSNCFMLADGESYRDRMALVLVYGNIQPKFYIANISQSKVLGSSAVVTKSMGPILMEVNGKPVIEYFKDLDLVKASETQYAMSSLPFLLDYGDGSPLVSKVFVALTPENYAICAGAMPEGSTFQIAMADPEDVLYTTEEAIKPMLETLESSSGALIYACVSRSMTLGAEQFKEMELIQEKLGGRLPFMMVCSGGEICPTQVDEEKAINRFHNNAFIACVF